MTNSPTRSIIFWLLNRSYATLTSQIACRARLGIVTWSGVTVDYLLPTRAGNMLGGVALVAMLNHGPVVAGSKQGTLGARAAHGALPTPHNAREVT